MSTHLRARALSSVRARPYLASSIFVLSQLTAAACWWGMPHYYKAQAVVVLDSNPSPVQLVRDDELGTVMPARVALLRSRLLVDRLVARLKLDTSARMRENWENMGPNRPRFEDWLAQLIAGGLVPEMSSGSYVLHVGYASPSPAFAMTMANAYAAELIDLVDVLNRGYDQIAARKIDASVSAARARWLASQKAALVDGENAPLLPGFSDPEMKRFILLNGLNTRTGTEYLGGRAATDVLMGMADPGVALDDSYLSKQQAILGDLRSQRAAAVTSMGAAHPVVKGLDASIAAAEGSIKLYKDKRRSSLGVELQVKQDVFGATSEQAALAKDALLLSAKRRQQYEARVTAADQAGDEYEQASSEQLVVALNQDVPRTDLQLLSLATQPQDAWFPQWYYYIPISMGMGMLYVWLGCWLTEVRSRRVRSGDDVEDIAGAELIGRVLKA